MRKILVIRFSSIGDIVLTTPVIRCLKKQLPDAEIHFLTLNQFEAILVNNPYIDKLWLTDKNLNTVISKLKNEKFTDIIDLHNNLRSLRIKLELNVKSKSVRKLNFKKWLLVNFKINLLPKIHIVDRYLETVKHLGVRNDGEGLDYFISSADENIWPLLPPAFLNGYAGIVIGAKHNTKIFPVVKLIEVIKQINMPVVLLGGKEDQQRGDEIAAATGKQCFNACGKFALNVSAAIVKHARVILTNDTGLMHIAAAFKKPVVSTWGNTVPEFGMTAYVSADKSAIHEITHLSCRPCSKIGYEKCPRGHFKCMNDLDEAQIAASIRRLQA